MKTSISSEAQIFKDGQMKNVLEEMFSWVEGRIINGKS